MLKKETNDSLKAETQISSFESLCKKMIYKSFCVLSKKIMLYQKTSFVALRFKKKL